jgi:tripartite-type tricarboxylate transporter receptor subunit TctC
LGRARYAGLMAVLLVAACSSSATPPPATQAPASQAPATAAAATAAPATAAPVDCEKGYPNKDVTLIVPYNPGGGFDVWARLVGPYLQTALPNKVNVLIENRAGAGGLKGMTSVFGSKPDGYTIGITEPGVLVTSQVAGTTEIDPAKFSALGQLTVSPEVMVVSTKSAYKTVADLQAAAASKGTVKMANGGVAAIQIVTFAALNIPFTSVVHEGSGESLLSVIRGDTDVSLYPLNTVLDYIKSGDMKPLVLIGTPPTAAMPGAAEMQGVPTLDSLVSKPGLGAGLEQHRILVAPPATPACVVSILSDALSAALANAELVAQAAKANLVVVALKAPDTQGIINATVSAIGAYADLVKKELAPK